MSRPAITVENLSKAYRIGLKEEIPDSLVKLATSWVMAPVRNWRQLKRLNTFGDRDASGGSATNEEEADLFWALQDVSFSVAEGEVVGIIGHNGAGKSTLLKILSRITEPTSGCARLRGRVSSLLEVGTGFHPELSGRENIYMNGTILGMTRREIDRKFDEIVDFSGVERFLDTPVKRYSSGMCVRLAFAVAAHLEPEILIIDEVLAVGDVEFQNKCLGKMEDVASSGRTVLFVSHNMAAIEALCKQAMLLSRGCIAACGGVSEVLDEYLAKGRFLATDIDLSDHPGRPPGMRSVLKRFRILDEAGRTIPAIRIGDDVSIELTLHSDTPMDSTRIFIDIEGSRGERVFTLSNRVQHRAALRLDGERVVRIRLRNVRLAPGRYHLRPRIVLDNDLVDTIADGLAWEIAAADVYGTGRLPHVKHGLLVPDVSWEYVGSSYLHESEIAVPQMGQAR